MSRKIYSVVFENDDFIAINKPAGLLTIPDREQATSLKDLLLDKYPAIYTVHRLDKETSGLLLFAKHEASHKYLSGIFEERKVEKYYLGIVKGLPPDSGTIDAPLSEDRIHKGQMVVHRDGKPSTTGYEVVYANKFYSLVRFRLYTGRTHQIRVHAKHIGHPLVADPLYGDGQPLLISSFKKKYKLSKNEESERPIINRVALHSYQLIFEDMHSNAMNLIAEMPKEFRALLNQLKSASPSPG